MICIAISQAAFESDSRHVAASVFGLRECNQERGECLVVMVGVALGHIVTDAI